MAQSTFRSSGAGAFPHTRDYKHLAPPELRVLLFSDLELTLIRLIAQMLVSLRDFSR